jgi:hypothetical protein
MDAAIWTARAIITTIPYLTIATVTPAGAPWNTPVYCAYDQALRFVWTSATTSQHSINLATNPQTFATLYDSTVPEGTGVGVYLRGTAGQIRDLRTAVRALLQLARRVGVPPRPLALVHGSAPRRLYQFVPEELWINGWVEADDVPGSGYDIRITLDLATVAQAVHAPDPDTDPTGAADQTPAAR